MASKCTKSARIEGHGKDLCSTFDVQRLKKKVKRKVGRNQIEDGGKLQHNNGVYIRNQYFHIIFQLFRTTFIQKLSNVKHKTIKMIDNNY